MLSVEGEDMSEHRAGRANPAMPRMRQAVEAHETERWKAYLTDDDPQKPWGYCPECAEREFED